MVQDLEDEEHSGQPSEVVNDQLRGSSKLILLQSHKKLPKNSTSTIPQSSGIWSKPERGKSLKSGCHMSWLQIKKKKNCHSEASSSLSLRNDEPFGTIMNHFLIRLWSVLKSWFHSMTRSLVEPRRRSKALPKAKLAPKKGSWSLFGGLLLLWSTTAFWIPAKSVHLRSMLSTSMRCSKNCNACSQNLSRQRAQFFPTTTSDQTSHNQCFKSRMNWAMKFCLIHRIHLIFRQPATTSLSISTTFCRENASTTSRRQKVSSKSLLNPEAWIFMIQE